MNDDDDTNNINSCSGFDNNRIGDGDDNCNINQISQVWGTWEELVLTCAVKRHAFTDWDSVAKDVQSRSRNSLIASAINCRLRYQDLKRRFEDSVDGGEGNREAAVVAAAAEDDEVGEIPWLDQLRSLHVAELRREVQRRDDSILSLQLKVKKLEEEEKDGDDGDNKPDLGNDETKPAKLNRETTESDRDDNRSMNESNSTASVDKVADHDGDKRVEAYSDPDPVNKAAAPKEEEEEKTVSKRSEMSNSGELDESGTSTGHGKRKGQKKYRSGGGGGEIKSAGYKSQPLIDTIKLIRSHPRGSVFESRLRSQETKDYKRVIRQHLDIKTIEKKLEKGSYLSSSLSFYRDLKLLFTNAIVFFPPSSSESLAAQELRSLVSNEIKKRTGILGHGVIKSEAGSSVSRQKSPVLPLVACKKNSSSSKKTSPSSSLKEKYEKKSQEVSEEKTVTTTTSARSSRRTTKEIAVVAKDTKIGRAKINNNKQKVTKTDSSSDDDDEKEETPKTEKKTIAIPSDKKKSVADFLKRIKKNSPQKGKETASKNQKKSDGNIKKENDPPKKNDGNVKKENSKAKPRELRSNSTGKKKAEVENNNSKSSSKRKQPKETAEPTGKRGRESGKDSKQPKKRTRR
ncbi:PREDICTED: bromodomain-containing protein bet-1-like isoform X1 [Camelina sativa]|uniref:Bromodomain-containing protein bet-1-like isoform X1 n=1 Tax=Camelina sativa TaxID=90675 RepID=A0ABM0WCT9_CAMSA|nr:PREDICTED: bromodomain-containing protein bet-1-like isoform X1 [Camelina sativa]